MIAEDGTPRACEDDKKVTAGKGVDSWGMNAAVTAVVGLP